VKLPRAFLNQMIAQAYADAPLETCGLLAGRDECASSILPVPNILKSQVKYRMGGQEFADAMVACDFQPLAIYHSHPQGPPVPSPTDIAEAFYPDSIYVIISLAQSPPSVRAFHIVDGVVTEETCQVLET
jgi:proteasome lid subunit RPN8/RPN11